jgi:hypothetical protein
MKGQAAGAAPPPGPPPTNILTDPKIAGLLTALLGRLTAKPPGFFGGMGGAATRGVYDGISGSISNPMVHWADLVAYGLPASWINNFNGRCQEYFNQGLDWAVTQGIKRPINWAGGKAVDAAKFGWKATLGDMATRPRDYAPKVFTAIFPTFIGILFAAYTNNLWFLFGFMSIGVVLVSPSPKDTAQEAFGLFGMRKASSGGLAYIRSIAKTTAIVCFAVGLRLMGDVFNFLLILVCFFGYFALNIEVDPKSPAQITESLIRFGFLGAYFIPFYIFGGIFHSVPLILITLAFFAVPPVFERGSGLLGGLKNVGAETGEMMNRLIFTAAMIITLVGVMTGIWDLAGTGTMQYVFLYFWVITFIGGVSSPSVSRPVIGALMLSASVIIFGLGPGSQDVGGALFGQWWPTLHNTIENGLKPVTEMFGALTSTFGQSFLLLTNPVGFAHQVIEGTYVNTEGAEKVGAFGVEIEEVRTTPVYVGQPFSVIVKVKNSGGFQGKNAVLRLDSSLKYSTSKYNIDDFVKKMQGVASSLDELATKGGSGTLTCPDSTFICPDGTPKTYYHTCETNGGCSDLSSIYDSVYASLCRGHMGPSSSGSCGNCLFICPGGDANSVSSTLNPTTKECLKCAFPRCSTSAIYNQQFCNGKNTAAAMEKLTSDFSGFYYDMKTIAVETYDDTRTEFSGIASEVNDTFWNAADWGGIGKNLYGLFIDVREKVVYPLGGVILSPECRNDMVTKVEQRWDGLSKSFNSLFGFKESDVPTGEGIVNMWPFGGFKTLANLVDIAEIPIKIIDVAGETFKITINALNAINCQLGRIDNIYKDVNARGTFTDRNGKHISFSMKNAILEIKNDDTGAVIAQYTKEQFRAKLGDMATIAENLISSLKTRVLNLLNAVKWNDIARNVADALKRTRNIAEKLSNLFGVSEGNVLGKTQFGFSDARTRKLLGNMFQKDTRQVFLESTGIECTIVANSELRKKYIPMNVTVTYGYEADSELSVDFISDGEWQRRAAANELTTTKIQSRMVSSPVKLSVSTFDQPLRSSQSFAVGFEVKSGEGERSMVKNAKIDITYPCEFGGTKCVGVGKYSAGTQSGDDCKLKWEVSDVDSKQGKAIWCNFDQPNMNMGDAPAKTYVVKAHADYNFTRWETANTEINFGGICCSKNDCASGQVCNGGSCISGETQPQVRIPGNAWIHGTQRSDGTVSLSKMDGNYQTNLSSYGKGNVTNYLNFNTPFSPVASSTISALYDSPKGADIDPAFAAAVFMYETPGGWATNTVRCNNLFGIRYDSSISGMRACPANPNLAAYFASFSDAFNAAFNAFSAKISGCVSQGRDTIKEIADSHCFHKDTDTNWVNGVSNYRAGIQRTFLLEYQ